MVIVLSEIFLAQGGEGCDHKKNSLILDIPQLNGLSINEHNLPVSHI